MSNACAFKNYIADRTLYNVEHKISRVFKVLFQLHCFSFCIKQTIFK